MPFVETSALTGLELVEPRCWVMWRAKWTRQCCLPSPGRTARTAVFTPVWASEMTT